MNSRQCAATQYTMGVHGDDGRFGDVDGVAGKPFVPRTLGYNPPEDIVGHDLTMKPPLQCQRNGNRNEERYNGKRDTKKHAYN